MKNTYILISFIVAVTLTSCENPLADFQLGFKDPIQESLLTIRIRDYANNIPENITVKLFGSDKDKIVTTLNTQKFKVNSDGFITFAVSPDFTPSAANPVNYTVSLSAEGYSPVLQPVRFTSSGNQTKYLNVAKLSDNSSEIAASVSVFKGLELVIDKTLSNGIRSKTDIKANTVFSTSENIKLSGNISVTTHAVGNGRKYFLPGGGLVANPFTPELKRLDESFNFKQIVQYTYFQIIDETGNIAQQVSQPINQRIYLSGSLQNPDKNRKVQSGDELTVVSYDEFANRWIKEKSVRIDSDATGLFADIAITHLSYWVVGWTQPLCSFGPKYVVKSDFKDIDINYLAQIKDVNTGAIMRQFYLSVNNGRSYNFNYFPVDENAYRLELLDFSNFRGGDRKVIATTETTSGCTVETRNVDVTTLKLPEPIQVTFAVNCPAGKTLDESLLPLEMRTQISEPGKNNWRDLLTFTRKTRDIKTYRLIPGNIYDFRISTDGGASWPYKQTDYTIEKAKWTIKIDAANYCK